MVMPREITERDRPNLIDALAAGRSQVTVRVFAIKKAGFNSHSLRYSAISEMADKVPLQVIAKITHHKSLDFIVNYTQQKKATRVLKEIAEEA
jgi:integrase